MDHLSVSKEVQNNGQAQSARPADPEMKFYNAVIMEEGERTIIGRTDISKISFPLPTKKWVMYYQNQRLKSFQSLKFGPLNPLLIMKRMEEFQLFVKGLSGETKTYVVNLDTKTEDLKEMIEKREGFPLKNMRLIFAGKQLEDGRTLTDEYYDIRRESTIHLLLRFRGGADELCGTISLKDLEDATETGVGEPLDPEDEETYWKEYLSGLNILGDCGNPYCPSRHSFHGPVYNLGYGYFSPHTGLLKCPACKLKTFKARNLLISGARSAINFRKTGEAEWNFTLLESLGPYPQYVRLAESNKREEYGDIEVTTVKLHESFRCCRCAWPIGIREAEIGKPCGHFYHDFCAEGIKNCLVCTADLLIGEAADKLFQE